MATNPLLLKLVEQTAANQCRESDVKKAVRREVQHNAKKVAEGRNRWFDCYNLPPVSVLARLSNIDRDALLAHYRAKELRKIADARHEGDDYAVSLAIKRLSRVNEVAKSFREVVGASWLAA